MKRMCVNLCYLLALLLATPLFAVARTGERTPDKLLVAETARPGAFLLTDCSICYDEADAPLVGITARLFADDLKDVFGRAPAVTTEPRGSRVIILGTLGKSRLVDGLVAAKKLDTGGIGGGWERFVIRRLDNPLPGVEQALVIAGSDRRGTAFGAFTLSEAMGVSAWKWWADVPVPQKSRLYVVDDCVSESPSVKYRGMFINDEDWGFHPWAGQNFEKERGDIGPRSYEKVCELILRLKGNMLAPAMHSCSKPFYYFPESKQVADRYGIIITTSHCEPLLVNNAALSEWDTKRDGEWNYVTNKGRIREKFNARVAEAAPYENIYTTGIRGLHDAGMIGNLTAADKVRVQTQVIADQRAILEKHLQRPAREIPQIFVPYKETMDIYEDGLQVPDDITLVWVDDNYGYLKRVSNPEERRRSGGAGVYYHLSYLGAPHDYLWLCTTPPVLMYAELRKAYDTGADRYWLLNVGDIKPMELGVQTFFDLAWDVDRFDYDTIHREQSRFLAAIFGEEYRDDLQDILDTYYRLAWSRKPEYMGWEREWDDPRLEQLADTEYSFDYYNDARGRLADYGRIGRRTAEMLERLPDTFRPAFFEMLGYPVLAAEQMNRKFLLAQVNHEQLAAGNKAAANRAAREARAAFDSIRVLNDRYNGLLDGKWDKMMALPKGWVAKYQEMPPVTCTDGAGEEALDLRPVAEQARLEGCTVVDLRRPSRMVSAGGHSMRVIEGVGYDWHAFRLGEPTEAVCDPTDLDGVRVEYALPAVDADSVTVYVYTLPFFPLFEGRSTRYGISVDGAPAVVASDDVTEYSPAWKDRVLRNGSLEVVTFPVDRTRPGHTLTLVCGDPGIMFQRIIVDWGGLKPTYVGPSVDCVIRNNKS